MSRLPGDLTFPVSFEVEGSTYRSETELPKAPSLTVTPSFFETFSIGLLQGRLFTAADSDESEHVAIVSRSFALRNFPGKNAVGQRIRAVQSPKKTWLTVVGIIPDTAIGRLASPDRAMVFLPIAQNSLAWMGIAIHMKSTPRNLMSQISRQVALLDPDLPVFGVDAMTRMIAVQILPYRVLGILFTVLGSAALFLATLGLYGVMAFTVTRRTQELGLRMALGAQSRDLLTFAFRGGFLPAYPGRRPGIGGGGSAEPTALLPLVRRKTPGSRYVRRSRGSHFRHRVAGLLHTSSESHESRPSLRIEERVIQGLTFSHRSPMLHLFY